MATAAAPLVIPYTGFIGPGYMSRSLSADGERCVNLFPEVIESGHGVNSMVLYGTPGLQVFATLPDAPIRAMATVDASGYGQTFAATDSGVYLINAGGNDGGNPYTALGNIASGGMSPVSIAANSAGQVVFASYNQGFLWDGTTLTPIINFPDASSFNGAVQFAYLDTYFIALTPGSNQFQISAPADGTSWSGLDFGVKESGSDILNAILVDHGELWLFGEQTTEIWVDTGAADFPFQRVQLIEQGCSAPWTPVSMDNSIFWLGADERGAGVVWRANGYTPTRVSNHAVEYAFLEYQNQFPGYDLFDAIAWTMQESGHQFYCLYFPTPNKTWCYDAATNMWHERTWFNVQTGIAEAHRARNHTYNFGSHLVGDRLNGNIYLYATDFPDDFGGPILRLRSSPHISQEKGWYLYHYIQFDFQMGVGLQTGQGQNPQIMVRWSTDGGFTWSNQQSISLGAVGQYHKRAILRRLGRNRDMVVEVSITDPVPVAMIDAYIKLSKGNGG